MKVCGSMYQAGAHCSSTKKHKRMRLLGGCSWPFKLDRSVHSSLSAHRGASFTQMYMLGCRSCCGETGRADDHQGLRPLSETCGASSRAAAAIRASGASSRAAAD
eukprot:CAMPEP_0113414188 /NCGR_PEP_ID=MMETSP0013_2-20120614/23870_1 /TAXON_ID=2843 ORGANISM="Skeletonema costatum, Strain 1716" /NCGR_SAMPLE_ID=MMETSP0013_2 /ASSEMBLY_ACC=CAM_ASM_000158 /LENGTH=104 /DNA_ID=CAMNT_0000301001 /DNA_START=372 /DNA_END=683 /DNA_ORIENTATION=- /assembly_acc=CAM_ASM_000158